jgi:hypothetical protein
LAIKSNFGMSDSEKKSHWKDIADLLGTPAPPDQPERPEVHEEQVATPEKTAAAPKREPRSSKPKTSPTNWFGLAADLGLPLTRPDEALDEMDSPDFDVDDDVLEETVAIQDESVELRSPSVEEGIPSAANLIEEEVAEANEPALSPFADNLVEAVDDTANAEPVSEAAIEVIAEEALPDADVLPKLFTPNEPQREPLETMFDPIPAREEMEAEERSADTDEDDLYASSFGNDAAMDEGSDAAESAGEETTVASEESTEDEERPRKRRRRRRRSKSESAEGDEAKSGEVAKEPARIERKSDEDPLDDEAADDSADDKPKGHRKIPSWEEAVGLIIAKNLEGREKASESGGGKARGRGGRSGRGGRGRRGRPKSGSSKPKS